MLPSPLAFFFEEECNRPPMSIDKPPRIETNEEFMKDTLKKFLAELLSFCDRENLWDGDDRTIVEKADLDGISFRIVRKPKLNQPISLISFVAKCDCDVEKDALCDSDGEQSYLVSELEFNERITSAVLESFSDEEKKLIDRIAVNETIDYIEGNIQEGEMFQEETYNPEIGIIIAKWRQRKRYLKHFNRQLRSG